MNCARRDQQFFLQDGFYLKASIANTFNLNAFNMKPIVIYIDSDKWQLFQHIALTAKMEYEASTRKETSEHKIELLNLTMLSLMQFMWLLGTQKLNYRQL